MYNKKQVTIHESASITGHVVIGDGGEVGQGVTINGPVVIGKDCRLSDGAVIENSILWDGVTIGENSHINRCIISSGTVIAADQNIEDNIVTPAETVTLNLPASAGK